MEDPPYKNTRSSSAGKAKDKVSDGHLDFEYNLNSSAPSTTEVFTTPSKSEQSSVHRENRIRTPSILNRLLSVKL